MLLESLAESADRDSDYSDYVASADDGGRVWKSEHGTMTIEPGCFVTEGAVQGVFSYMERCYQAVSALKMTETADLFSGACDGNRELNRNAWEYLIGLRAMQKPDLTLEEYRFELTVTAAVMKDDGSLYLHMNENNVQRFTQHSDIESEFYRIAHRFEMVNQGGGWKIRKHLQSDGIYQNLMGEYWDSDLDTCMEEDWEIRNAGGFFALRRESLLRQAKEQMILRSRDNGSPSLPVTAHPYDREAAVSYADRWIGVRNGDWADFTGQGGNCQNFVSQCLYAGGIPRDISGGETWSWKRSDTALPEDAKNTLPWINVEAFRSYTVRNRGYGLAVQRDAPYLSGEPGDIIQMGFPERWSHTVLITKVVTDREGRTVDYLVDSNTADLRNVPVSAYSLPCQTLTKIAGWNER